MLCLEADLNKNAVFDTWMEDNLKNFNTFRDDDPDENNKVTSNDRGSSGSAIQLSSQTCFMICVL